MSKLNNIRPAKAAKLLEDHGWKLYNRKGTHETYIKTVDGKNYFCQVMHHSKTIYWKNVKIMISKSLIPEGEWIKNCK